MSCTLDVSNFHCHIAQDHPFILDRASRYGINRRTIQFVQIQYINAIA